MKKRLRTLVPERITSYFGHVMRRSGFEKLIIHNKVKSFRGRERTPSRNTDIFVKEVRASH